MQPGLLPLFPLQLVLMPGAHLPLHIFEERYKEMIGEALRDNTEFGVVLVSGRGLEDTGCTASVEGVLREYPDGRLDIVTLGRRRFEIHLVNQERSFLRGAVEFFDDDPEPAAAEPAFRAAAIAAYNTLQEIWKNPPLEESAYTDPHLSFRLARAVRDLAFRQALLKSRSERERIERLAEYLAPYALRASREQAAQTAAPNNGHPWFVNGNGRIH
jgi:Lon protease-like protein